jgi:hypothetical protein
MSKAKKTAIGIVVLILLIAGVSWAWMQRPDPQVEKVKQLGAEAFKPGVTEERRQEIFQQIHQEMEQLQPAQRHQVMEAQHEHFERQMDRQMKTYFSMSPVQRTAYLDEQIKKMEQGRKAMEARMAKGNQNGGRRGQGGQGGRPQGAGPQGGNGAQQGGQRPPQNLSSDERQQRRNQWLDRSTAEQRTMRSTFMADMRQRRIQLGLPADPPRGSFPRPR